MTADPGTFAKSNALAAPGFFAAEAAGLRWLGAAAGRGGVRTADVLEFSPTGIVLERIRPGRATTQRAEDFGRALAVTHAAGAAGWGSLPPGTDRAFIATLPLPLGTPADTWGEFYAHDLLEPLLRQAIDDGFFGAGERKQWARLVDRIADGELTAPQPELVRQGDAGEPTDPPERSEPNGPADPLSPPEPHSHAGSPDPAARLHGDLWAGNVLWSDADDPGGAVLIDPSAHGGHAETDLAMLDLFGLSHLDRVLAAYDEVSPLADGWRDRIALHQLYPLLVHTVLFGGGYGAQAAAAASRY